MIIYDLFVAEIEEIDYGSSMIMLNRMDNTFELLNRAIAELEWQTLTNNHSIISSEIYVHFVHLKLKFKNEWCAKLMDLQNVSLNRKLLRFLCGGPRYTNEIAGYDRHLIIEIKNPLNP